MNQIQNGQQCDEYGNYGDFDWNEFVESLFKTAPQDPFSFTMSFLDQIDELKLSTLLGNMLITGAKNKYGKEIAQLDQNEIDELQKYYHSIGYMVKYEIETTEKFVSELKKTVPVNLFKIDFLPYPVIYDRHNQPDKLGSVFGSTNPYR